MKAQPGYDAAKGGDFIEGAKVARAAIKSRIITKLKASLPSGTRVIVVPVRSPIAGNIGLFRHGLSDAIEGLVGIFMMAWMGLVSFMAAKAHNKAKEMYREAEERCATRYKENGKEG